MELEKQKRLEQEQKAREEAERKKLREEAEKAAEQELKDEVDANGLPVVRKSRFVRAIYITDFCNGITDVGC